LATALALYNFKKNGTPLNTAIDSANTRVSTILGLDITSVIPVNVTDSANTSSTLTPEFQYGWMSAAISLWTYNAVYATDPTEVHTRNFTSIAYAELMYEDVINDGLLDGIGAAGPLSFAPGVALDQTVYRFDIGQDMVAFTGNPNNATGLQSGDIIAAAKNFASNTDMIWGDAAVLPFDPPAVTFTNPIKGQWLRGTTTVAATVSSISGIQSESLLIDGQPLTVFTTNLDHPSYSWNTSTVQDGAHTLALGVTNLAGITTQQPIDIYVDNTAPTLGGISIPTGTVPYQSSVTCAVSGNAADAGSGIGAIDITLDSGSAGSSHQTVVPNAMGQWTANVVQYL
jgi:hypothetical protein